MRKVCKRLCCLVAIAGIPVAGLAQMYDGPPCRSGGDASIRAKLKLGVIKKLSAVWFGDYQNWSTSYLPASGKPPPARDCGNDDECLEQSLIEDHTWTCQYSARSARDGNPRTAWCEGVKGDGIGEILLAEVDTRRPVQVWAGYGKSRKLHRANGRPRKVRLSVLRADEFGVTENGPVYGGLHVLATHEVELKDVFGYQPLPLPEHAVPEKNVATVIAVEILSVFKGDRYRDTCISEIKTGS